MTEPEKPQHSNALIATLVSIEAWLGRVLMAIFRGVSGLVQWAINKSAAAGERVAAWPAWRKRALWIGAAIVALGTIFWNTRDPIVNWYEATSGHRPLLKADSWYYHLDRTDASIIQSNNADLVVMDYAKEGGRVPFSKDDIEKIKVRKDGSKRLVVSYLSVGESETYRWYWQKGWEGADAKRPSWLVAPNCAWPGAWSIRFWDPGWKEIVFAGAHSYLKRIIDAGFDGVYLDRVDIFEQFTGDKHKPDMPADPEWEMVKFVTELAETARRLKPGFLIIPQNGEPLLLHKKYRRAIDGLGKEDLLFGHAGTGERNPAKDIKWSQDHLKVLLGDYKPIFAVEYLVTKEAIAYATLEMRQRGLVPTFADRSLDGSDPTMPRFDQKQTEGTPEWIKTMCNKGNSW